MSADGKDPFADTQLTPPGGVPAVPSGTPGEALQPGQLVGEYRVEKKLGEGGMGAVFAGVHPRIGKKVAIKVLAKELATSQDLVDRFENEARAVNEIGNRNIVDIFAFGQLPDGSPYFVMEWLQGEGMDEFLERVGTLDYAQAMPIVRQIGRALAAAHGKNIVHRDLKPENVWLCKESDGAHFVKLLDFGIAKFAAPEGVEAATKTRTGMMMGTPYFMSPEQARGRDVDHRTDIYAMGVMLFRMFTGTYPFDGESPMVIIAHHLNDAPPRASSVRAGLSAELDAIIDKALRKEPNDRQQSITEMLQSLEACAATLVPAQRDLPAPQPSLEPTQAPVEPPKSTPGKWIVAAVAAVAIAGGAMYALSTSNSSGTSTADPGKQPAPTDVRPLLRYPEAKSFSRSE